MKIASALPATVLALLAQPGQAQPLRPAADEAVEHTGSGWVFPKHVGDYTRGSDPECIAGTANDCGANYEDSRAMAATVYVYPDDSPAADASYAGAKAVIEQDLEQQPFAQAWSEGPFRVGSARPLVGEKIFYKIGIGADSTQTSLYFFDTGRWIVKIRISGRVQEVRASIVSGVFLPLAPLPLERDETDGSYLSRFTPGSEGVRVLVVGKDFDGVAFQRMYAPLITPMR